MENYEGNYYFRSPNYDEINSYMSFPGFANPNFAFDVIFDGSAYYYLLDGDVDYTQSVFDSGKYNFEYATPSYKVFYYGNRISKSVNVNIDSAAMFGYNASLRCSCILTFVDSEEESGFKEVSYDFRDNLSLTDSVTINDVAYSMSDLYNIKIDYISISSSMFSKLLYQDLCVDPSMLLIEPTLSPSFFENEDGVYIANIYTDYVSDKTTSVDTALVKKIAMIGSGAVIIIALVVSMTVAVMRKK